MTDNAVTLEEFRANMEQALNEGIRTAIDEALGRKVEADETTRLLEMMQAHHDREMQRAIRQIYDLKEELASANARIAECEESLDDWNEWN